jgi:hypothetical protein
MGKSNDAAGVHESADAARDESTEPWDLRLLSGMRLVLVLLSLAGAGLVILRRETGIADTAETVWWSVTGVTVLATVRSCKAVTIRDRSRGRPVAPVVVVRFHQDKPLILGPLHGVWPWSAHPATGPDAVQLAAVLSTLQRATH